MSNPAQVILEPQGIDRALAALQAKVDAGLPWLDNVYGQVEVLINQEGAVRGSVFAIYSGVGAADYITVMPDERVGSFVAFLIDDHKYSGRGTNMDAGLSEETAEVAVIAFWDYGRAYPDDGHQRTVRHIEEQLITALSSTRELGLSFEVTGTETAFKKVFAGADVSDVDARLSRRPYGYLRVEGSLVFSPAKIACYDVAYPPPKVVQPR